MHLPLSKILTGDSYVICGYIAESFVFEDGIVQSMPNKLSWKSGKLWLSNLCSH